MSEAVAYELTTQIHLPVTRTPVINSRIDKIDELLIGVEEAFFKVKAREDHQVVLLYVSRDRADENWISELERAVRALGEKALVGARVTTVKGSLNPVFSVGPSERDRRLCEMNYAIVDGVASIRANARIYRHQHEPEVTLERSIPAMRGLYAATPTTLVVGIREGAPEAGTLSYIVEGGQRQAKARIAAYMQRFQDEPDFDGEVGMPEDADFKPLYFLDQKGLAKVLARMDPTDGFTERFYEGEE